MRRIVLCGFLAGVLWPGAAAGLGPAPSWQLTQGAPDTCSVGGAFALPGVEINIPAGQASEQGVLSAPGFPALGVTIDNALGPFVGTLGFTVFANAAYALPPGTPLTLQVATYAGPNFIGAVTYVSRLTWNCTTGAVIPAPTTGPCAGFTDVDVGSQFCANVEWMKNRGITQGCSATAYCPGSAVSRLQMAAFMHRLGSALQPFFVHAAQTNVQATVNADGVVCQTIAYPVTGFPRVATVTSALFYHTAPSAVEVNARPVYSVDAGATWSNFGSMRSYATNPAGVRVSQAPVAGARTFVPGQTVRFGLRANSTLASISDAGCEMLVRLESLTGPFTPFDPAPDQDDGRRSSGG